MTEPTPDLAKPKPSVTTVTGWTIFFMVLLRIAIGWHFFYEGMYKLVQPDWRATGYLTASVGPFRPLFMMMVRDPDGLQARLTEFGNYYTVTCVNPATGIVLPRAKHFPKSMKLQAVSYAIRCAG